MFDLPEGAEFGKLFCVESVILVEVMRDGSRIDMLVIGPCPHCSRR